MFGWEFPPIYSGGLGTACLGLVKGLSHHNIQVTFVMPKGPENASSDYAKLLVAENVYKNVNIKIKKIKTIITPYMTSHEYDEKLAFISFAIGGKSKGTVLYGHNLHDEVFRFGIKAKFIAENEEFDIIHCHDWMTFQAGINAKLATGKPLVVHVHATEFNRSGGSNINQWVYEQEKKGMEMADKVVPVSHFMKSIIMEKYGIPEHKIEVIHNAIELGEKKQFKINKSDKIVLFLGRITLQKGPDYFIEAAKKVLDLDPTIKFVFVGSGDMEGQIINRVAELGISDKVLFTGFLRGDEINKIYQMADVYVMPSVSEPFGLTPLEAIRNGTPVIISKQSGVSEVLHHCLKVDFWDIDELANKIVAVLSYQSLHSTLKSHGEYEIKKFNWNVPAEKCSRLYNKLMGG